jgi:metal-responsive CopG/Arc/MetJ family transcriptional regulator
MRANYATVKIPQELAEKLDEFVADLGYRSRAEIVNDAIRRFIDERKRLDSSRLSSQKVVEEQQQPIILRH